MKIKPNSNAQPTLWQRLGAWAVHGFTASGLVFGFLAMLAIRDHQWPEAMSYLFICLVIDGVDGTFARWLRVGEVLPEVDGKAIDYVVDFATYAIIPAYFFYESALVPVDWQLPCTFVILLVSALYYGKTGMVSADYYFVGFPVLWNLVVFYLFFIFQFSGPINIVLIFLFAILHFIPIKVAYPSQATRWQGLSLAVCALSVMDWLLILWNYPERPIWMIGVAWSGLLYFTFLTIYDTWLAPKKLT